MGEASLEDYAYVARGLLDWADATGSRDDLAIVRQVVDQGWRRFHGPDGWRQAEALQVPIGVAEPILPDGPMPSPSAVLIGVSLELAERLGDPRLYTRALDALMVESDALVESPFFYATHIGLLGRYSAGGMPGG